MNGWRWRVPMMIWHSISIDGWRGWELDGDPHRPGHHHPPFVTLKIRNGFDKSSEDIANEWDEVAEGNFYSRDFPVDGIPTVAHGEVYTAGFWFETRAERDRFVKRFGGTPQ